MNWFDQSRMKNLLILLLLLMNLVTISIVWMQTRSAGNVTEPPRQNTPSESVRAMQGVVGFSDAQAQQFGSVLKEYRERTRPVNERMSSLKKQLAESVFSAGAGADSAERMSEEIGRLQQQLEYLRYQHFRTVAAMCDSAQRVRLRPILQQLFGRKPPKEGPEPEWNPSVPKNGARPEREPRRGAMRQEEGRPAPPPVEEKVRKYTERLDLTKEQQRQLTELLSSLRQEQRGNRAGGNEQKEQIRRMEDQRVMELLTPEQREEFRRMQERRGR